MSLGIEAQGGDIYRKGDDESRPSLSSDASNEQGEKHKLPRHRSFSERFNATADNFHNKELESRARALDELLGDTGNSLVKDTLGHVAQRLGDVRRVSPKDRLSIPDRYESEEAHKQADALLTLLRSDTGDLKVPLRDVFKQMMKPDAKVAPGFKLAIATIGYRILQLYGMEENENWRSQQFGENRRQRVRLGEMMIMSTVVTDMWTEFRRGDGSIKQGRATAFYTRFSQYARNDDLPNGFRAGLLVAMEELERSYPALRNHHPDSAGEPLMAFEKRRIMGRAHNEVDAKEGSEHTITARNDEISNENLNDTAPQLSHTVGPVPPPEWFGISRRLEQAEQKDREVEAKLSSNLQELTATETENAYSLAAADLLQRVIYQEERNDPSVAEAMDIVRHATLRYSKDPGVLKYLDVLQDDLDYGHLQRGFSPRRILGFLHRGFVADVIKEADGEAISFWEEVGMRIKSSGWTRALPAIAHTFRHRRIRRYERTTAVRQTVIDAVRQAASETVDNQVRKSFLLQLSDSLSLAKLHDERRLTREQKKYLTARRDRIDTTLIVERRRLDRESADRRMEDEQLVNKVRDSRQAQPVTIDEIGEIDLDGAMEEYQKIEHRPLPRRRRHWWQFWLSSH